MTTENDKPREDAQFDELLPAKKKAYVKPTLRRLGTVRELTQVTLSSDGK